MTKPVTSSIKSDRLRALRLYDVLQSVWFEEGQKWLIFDGEGEVISQGRLIGESFANALNFLGRAEADYDFRDTHNSDYYRWEYCG